jgi:hypothetical protein
VLGCLKHIPAGAKDVRPFESGEKLKTGLDFPGPARGPQILVNTQATLRSAIFVADAGGLAFTQVD